MRVPCSRGWGETAGSGEWGFGDAGKETGNTQVGGGPPEEDGDDGADTGEYQMGRGPREGAGVGTITGIGLGTSGGGGIGTGVETGGRGASIEAEKSEVKKLHNNKQKSLRLYQSLNKLGTP